MKEKGKAREGKGKRREREWGSEREENRKARGRERKEWRHLVEKWECGEENVVRCNFIHPCFRCTNGRK